jgi:Uma2 family endonuclease
MPVELLRRKFTVEQYHQMAEAGILTEDDRVELIRGEIVEMSPVGRRHAACVKRFGCSIVA